jgi:hypothetical protein
VVVAVEGFLGSLMSLLTSGKSAADVLPIVMSLVIWHLLVERKKLIEDNKKKDEKIDKILDDYYKGNLTLTEALNSLKLVLYEIRGNITFRRD